MSRSRKGPSLEAMGPKRAGGLTDRRSTKRQSGKRHKMDLGTREVKPRPLEVDSVVLESGSAP